MAAQDKFRILASDEDEGYDDYEDDEEDEYDDGDDEY